MSKHKLSLATAVLVNVNIMLGTGTFINTVILAQHVGTLGFVLYLIAGSLMLPLVLCFAQFMTLHHQGNFYNFGATINSFWGFISAWSYFTGKLASAALSIHVFTLFLQHVLPITQTVPTLLFDCILIGLFVFLNLQNLKTGSRIQLSFVFMKLLPLLFAIIIGLSYYNGANIGAPHQIWSGIPIALPLVLFCFLGFEATCSLSGSIENSKLNGPRAILLSFFTVIVLSVLYQFAFYVSTGELLAQQQNYVTAFPLLITKIAPTLLNILSPLFSSLIALSALGGSYGIIYSNAWNLFSLAEHKHLLFFEKFKQLNRHQIPALCVITEGVICIGYLLLTQGAQVPLQYTAVLGCIMAYSITVLAYYKEAKTTLGLFGLVTCCILLGVCLNGFVRSSIAPLMIFTLLLATGSAMFYATRVQASES